MRLFGRFESDHDLVIPGSSLVWGGCIRFYLPATQGRAPAKGNPMALDIELLRENFNLVVERSPTVTKRFYEILFERYPQARSLFGRRSQEAQEQMLTQALV